MPKTEIKKITQDLKKHHILDDVIKIFQTPEYRDSNTNKIMGNIALYRQAWIKQISEQISNFREEWNEYETKKLKLYERKFQRLHDHHIAGETEQKEKLTLKLKRKILKEFRGKILQTIINNSNYMNDLKAQLDKFKLEQENKKTQEEEKKEHEQDTQQKISKLFYYTKMGFLLGKFITKNPRTEQQAASTQKITTSLMFKKMFNCLVKKNLNEFREFAFTLNTLGELTMPILGSQNTAWGNAKAAMLATLILVMRKTLPCNRNKSLKELLGGEWNKCAFAYPTRIPNDFNIPTDFIFLDNNEIGNGTENRVMWQFHDGFAYGGGCFENPPIFNNPLICNELPIRERDNYFSDEFILMELPFPIKDCGRVVSYNKDGFFSDKTFNTFAYWSNPNKIKTNLENFLFKKCYSPVLSQSDSTKVLGLQDITELKHDDVIYIQHIDFNEDVNARLSGGHCASIITIKPMNGYLIVVTFAGSRDVQTESQKTYFGPAGMSGHGIQCLLIRMAPTPNRHLILDNQQPIDCPILMLRNHQILISAFRPRKRTELDPKVLKWFEEQKPIADQNKSNHYKAIMLAYKEACKTTTTSTTNQVEEICQQAFSMKLSP